MSVRKIPISLHQQILSGLVSILASAYENVFDTCRKLERVPAPDNDISFATGLQRANAIRNAEHLRRSKRDRPECIFPGEAVGDSISCFLLQVADVEGFFIAAAGISDQRDGNACRCLTYSAFMTREPATPSRGCQG